MASKRIQIENNRIIVNKVNEDKKIRITALPVLLGSTKHLKWSTPFSIWCELALNIYVKKSTVKTEMGIKMEPRIIQYYRNLEKDYVLTPEEKYGYFERRDFFNDKLFKGKWDALIVDPKNHDQIKKVLEIKTTEETNKNEWKNGIPFGYKVQAGMYAYLLNVNEVVFATTFINKSDYNAPIITLSPENTKIYMMNIKKDFADFEKEIVAPVKNWYENYYLAKISPEFNINNPIDKEYLDLAKEKYQVF